MSDTALPDVGVTVGNGEFRIDGKTERLYGGAVHYWRLDRDKWDGILQSVKDLGFTMISIYIPWEAHETARGVFDLGSRTRGPTSMPSSLSARRRASASSSGRDRRSTPR